MTRIEQMKEIAKGLEVKATIKQLGSNIFANVNGVSFKVNGLATFEAKCKELKNYVAPAPVELTSRLERIERMTVSSL
jgi:hypothetical protein